MAALLANVASVSTTLFDIVGTTVTTITKSGNELLLVFMLIAIVGAGVGLFQRIRG
jgi:hypothetical protein